MPPTRERLVEEFVILKAKNGGEPTQYRLRSIGLRWVKFTAQPAKNKRWQSPPKEWTGPGFRTVGTDGTVLDYGSVQD